MEWWFYPIMNVVVEETALLCLSSKCGMVPGRIILYHCYY